MERDIDMKAVSDGKLYGANDLVKVGCDDCSGCSACCHGMGSSITLDPYDIFELTQNLEKNFGQLMEESVELNVVDGIILPNLKMAGDQEACVYLNEQGRCSIHGFRPGICRLFPLGRIYENGSFQYFLQVHECAKESRTKMKVKKWLDIPSLARYERFVADWHYFLKGIQQEAMEVHLQDAGEAKAAAVKQINMYLLQVFYVQPYEKETDFYQQFEARLAQAKTVIEAYRKQIRG